MKRIPEYKNLYQILRKQIINGKYKPGDLLASESELRNTHNLSQPTVRKAVELLEKEGIVIKHHGKGSIIQNRPIGAGIVSFDGELRASKMDNKHIKTEIIQKQSLVNPFPSCFGFIPGELEINSKYWYIERIRSFKNKIIFHESLCFPNKNLPGLSQLNFNNTSFYETIFKKYEIVTTHCEQRFWAIQANEDISNKLGLEIGMPVQRLQRKFSTNLPGFYIYSNLIANTDTIYLVNHLK